MSTGYPRDLVRENADILLTDLSKLRIKNSNNGTA